MHLDNPTRRLVKEDGRRAQIISAAIHTLAELGYVNTTLAQIAKRASISTGLVLYHFKNKEDLLKQTHDDITAKWLFAIHEGVAAAKTPHDKLHAYIQSNLFFMVKQPQFMAARIEIDFNARDEKGRLTIQTGSYDIMIAILEDILREGQAIGVFKDFNIESMAIIIRASIDQYLGLLNIKSFDTSRYVKDVLQIFDTVTMRS